MFETPWFHNHQYIVAAHVDFYCFSDTSWIEASDNRLNDRPQKTDFQSQSLRCSLINESYGRRISQYLNAPGQKKNNHHSLHGISIGKFAKCLDYEFLGVASRHWISEQDYESS